MTAGNHFTRMSNDEGDQSPEKCKERRQRRIEMRRLAAITACSSSSSSPRTIRRGNGDLAESSSRGEELNRVRGAVAITPTNPPPPSSEELNQAVSDAAVTDRTPIFGLMGAIGRCREMEDTICVRKSLCRPEISRRRPVHFFAVFDGHGGPHVSGMCSKNMHEIMEEELMRVRMARGESSAGRAIVNSSGGELDQEEEWLWRKAIKRCFERMDEVALGTCGCSVPEHHHCWCGCHPLEVAMTGSTAVVALMTPGCIIVANCSDSRAVLCRRGRAIPLSTDHKPDRADERARIEASRGRVIFINCARVEGILGMSRAIGDKYLKPTVISEPEISITRRDPGDECLILASDGLWDALSNDMACEVASECLREQNVPIDLNTVPPVENTEREALYSSRCTLAAVLLTRLALGRNSADNISVVVVDLKRS